MPRLRSLLVLLMVGGLAGCSAVPAEWRAQARAASDTVALHLVCTGDGLMEVSLGTFNGGVKGAVAGANTAVKIVDGQVDHEAALVLVGGGAAVGGTIGAGAGMGGEIINLPETYGECLRTRGPDFGRPAETPS